MASSTEPSCGVAVTRSAVIANPSAQPVLFSVRSTGAAEATVDDGDEFPPEGAAWSAFDCALLPGCCWLLAWHAVVASTPAASAAVTATATRLELVFTQCPFVNEAMRRAPRAVASRLTSELECSSVLESQSRVTL